MRVDTNNGSLLARARPRPPAGALRGRQAVAEVAGWLNERSTSRPSSRNREEDARAIAPHGVIGWACAVALVAGFVFSDALNLSPSDGVGYALGIGGLTAMVLLLLYSVRKRVALLRRAGSMRAWFEAHLVLGLLGPTAILYHCNFELGSMNSTVSLFCMLAVAGSGIGGRFLYGRMHRSLAGGRRTVRTFLNEARDELSLIDSVLDRCPEARQRMQTFAVESAASAPGLATAHRIVTNRVRARANQRRVLGEIRDSARPHVVAPSVREAVRRYFSAVVRSQDLRFFEQLFSLWHAIHVPLTFLLLLSAAIHVVAVHLY